VAGRVRRGSVPAESVARSIGVALVPDGTCVAPGVAAGRRPVAVAGRLWSRRAGEAGGTGPWDEPVCDRPVWCGAGSPRHTGRRPVASRAVTLARDPSTRAPSLRIRRPTRVMRHRAFFAWRSATRSSRARPGRATQVLPSALSPDGAPGVQPTLRRFAPADRVDARRERRGRTDLRRAIRRAGGSSGAAFLPVRAHVSFGAPRSAPIDFRRGDRPPVGETREKERSAGDEMASTSGLRLPSAVRAPDRLGPGPRSCLGLCLSQGCSGTRYRASAGLDPVADHQPPARSPYSFVGDRTYPLVGLPPHRLTAPSPGPSRGSCSRGGFPGWSWLHRAEPARARRSLQRVDEADALPI